MTGHWRQIPLVGFQFERLIAFSLPVADRIALIAYDGVVVLGLDGRAIYTKTTVTDSDVPDTSSSRATVKGVEYATLGLHGGTPILESSGRRLDLDRVRAELTVRVQGQIEFEFRFKDMSGDWMHASFSRDGRHVLLGAPYDFFLFARSDVP